MTAKKVLLKKNTYYDSVYLMGISEKLEKIEGLINYHVLMATEENKVLMESSGFEIKGANSNDLVIAIEAESNPIIDNAYSTIEYYLNNKIDGEDKKQYDSLEDALGNNTFYNLALISIPGEYVAVEAEKAINAGLNVFIFSDNVKPEDELKIKKLAIEKNLLVMGPDAGVGSINGIALATGSKLKKGPIGIIAASGSGAQEISAIIDRNGIGTSQLIGTGGKDLTKKIRGLSMLYAMNILEDDPDTKVIVLVSKLADMGIINTILSEAQKLNKPVVAIFLGANHTIYKKYNKVIPAYTLEEAAIKAMSVIKESIIEIGFSESEIEKIAENEAAKYAPSQKYIRGLYMGGTFAEEAILILNKRINGKLYSNIKSDYSILIEKSNPDKGHVLIDMGAEEYTKNKPHPVIDPSNRIKEFVNQADNKNTAVILLDYILSYGVHPDPVGAIINLIKEKKKEAQNNNRHLTIISSICGTIGDPQNLEEQEKKLKDAGVIVAVSNTQVAKLAAKIVSKINS